MQKRPSRLVMASSRSDTQWAIARGARPSCVSDGCFKSGTLPPDQWTQGKAARSALRVAAARTEKSVVALANGGETVGLGTVVGDGLVLTKASILPRNPACRLADGKIVPAEIIGADPA